jgi:hypothetical protein
MAVTTCGTLGIGAHLFLGSIGRFGPRSHVLEEVIMLSILFILGCSRVSPRPY